MNLKLIKIGNSKGVRIPKDYLLGFAENTQFELIRKGDNLILSPNKNLRRNWIDQIIKEKKEMDTGFILNDFDENDWEWK